MRTRQKNIPSGERQTPSRLTPEEIRQRTFDRAVKLLAAKPRSIAELREQLMQGRNSGKTAVETVIARLKEYGYLDDERFALGYASLKVQQRPVGRQRLEQELTLKRVDRAVADGALDQVYAEVSEEALLDRVIEKRIGIRGRPKNRAEAKSLFEYLVRRGFPCEMVSEKVRAAAQVPIDEVE